MSECGVNLIKRAETQAFSACAFDHFERSKSRARTHAIGVGLGTGCVRFHVACQPVNSASGGVKREAEAGLSREQRRRTRIPRVEVQVLVVYLPDMLLNR